MSEIICNAEITGARKYRDIVKKSSTVGYNVKDIKFLREVNGDEIQTIPKQQTSHRPRIQKAVGSEES